MAYTLVPTELIVDGAVTSAKLDTNISISGTLGVTGELTLATHMIMGDNDKIKIGTGGDLEIYHDGSNSYISNSTGNIYLADTNGSVHIQAKLNEESIVCAADGAVTLYHDNAVKLATSSAGVSVTGTLAATLSTASQPNITSVGTLTGFTSTGIDDNATSTAITIDSSERVLIGKSSSTDSAALEIDANNVGSSTYSARIENSNTATNIFNVLRFAQGESGTATGIIGTGGSLAGNTAFRNTFAMITQNATGLVLGTNDTERMRIDSSGNLGIGTSSPQRQLHVLKSANNTHIAIERDGTDNPSALILGANQNRTEIISSAAEESTSGVPLTFLTGNTERMRIDSSGNVGIGATPSSTIRNDISSAEKALQIGNRAMFFSDGGVTTDLQNNSHLNNSNARVAMQTDAGSLYQQYQGVHKWFNAASVSAGATQTMTERMRIDSSGRVLVGLTGASGFGTLEATSFTTEGSCYLARSSGNVFVGTTGAIGPGIIAVKSTATTTGCLGLHNTNNGGSFIRFANAANNAVIGVIQNNNDNSTSYITTSDYRLKENVNYDFNALDRISQLKPARFNFINNINTTVDGFLAHEVQSIVPEAITGEKDAVDDEGNPDYQGIDQSKLVPLLTKAIQEQQTIIDDLKSRIETLENE